ncbi:phosphatase PAP2 family protein [Hymenobacter sp. BT770]|uniref:phosphatase PAP2 family protein n=1 Tax=Hymenobacter sp. BT770 TaxID=2886942 RepID=UPI001D0F9567|nr:phosphatase PAP2 family protein [Hymenobacter sp. BT770]MCC3152752.1 phosphatase PAP2 family protein [Hymenobacter sp. BT770]MDO3414825.1 phosphatase PAP2 family protein [Hymenobacter sp. BT770]
MPDAAYWMRVRAVLRVHSVLLLALVLPWAVFAIVAKSIWQTGGFVGDRTILKLLHRHSSPVLDNLATTLTDIGDTGPMVAVGCLIAIGLLWRRHYREALVFALSVGGAMGLTQVLKALFARPRPELWLSIKPAQHYSFPSGHAMDTAALAAAISFLLWQYRAHWLGWTVGPLFALSVGWARMYLGVHYPSDVVAGLASSVGWVTGIHVLFSPIFAPQRRRWHQALHQQLPSVVSPPKQPPAATTETLSQTGARTERPKAWQRKS